MDQLDRLESPPLNPSASRMKRSRQRKQAGAACTTPRPVAREVIDALIAADLLREAERGDRDAVTEAVHRACDVALAPVIANAEPARTSAPSRSGTIRVTFDVAANAIDWLVAADLLDGSRRAEPAAVGAAVVAAAAAALQPIRESMAELRVAEERRRAAEARRRVEAEEEAARKQAEAAEFAARKRARDSNPELREYWKKHEREYLDWERARAFRGVTGIYQ